MYVGIYSYTIYSGLFQLPCPEGEVVGLALIFFTIYYHLLSSPCEGAYRILKGVFYQERIYDQGS